MTGFHLAVNMTIDCEPLSHDFFFYKIHKGVQEYIIFEPI